MATIRIVLGIICLIALGCSTEPGSGVLKGYGLCVMSYVGKNKAQVAKPAVISNASVARRYLSRVYRFRSLPSVRDDERVVRDDERTVRNDEEQNNTLLNIARSQLGVRETTGKNDGHVVAAYLKVVHLKEGQPWCAAFISWVFAKAGYAQPRTAWSPSLFPIAKQTKIIRPAHVFGIYFKALKRIAHAGLVEEQQGNWIVTIEGNTNVSGSREGDGVYRKRRHIKTIKLFADWLK